MKNSKEIAATVFKKRDEHLKNSMIKRRRVKKYAYIGSTACLCAIVVAGAKLLNINNVKKPSVFESTISESTQSSTTVEESSEDVDIQTNTSNTHNNSATTSESSSNDISSEQPSSNIHTEILTDGIAVNTDSAAETDTNNQTQTSKPDKTESTSGDEVVRERRWDEKTLTQQFPEFFYQNIQYGLRDATIENDYIEGSIGSILLTGYDDYESKEYSITANVYQIKEISNQVAVALKFENTSSFYVYFNRNYIPYTLGTLIDDLNLENTIVLGNMYVNDCVHVENYPTDVVRNLLFSNRECEYMIDKAIHDTIVSFSVNVPLLGIENKSIALTKDGYITTNIMERKILFYIGESKINEICESLNVYDINDTNTVIHEPKNSNLVLE